MNLTIGELEACTPLSRCRSLFLHELGQFETPGMIKTHGWLYFSWVAGILPWLIVAARPWAQSYASVWSSSKTSFTYSLGHEVYLSDPPMQCCWKHDMPVGPRNISWVIFPHRATAARCWYIVPFPVSLLLGRTSGKILSWITVFSYKLIEHSSFDTITPIWCYK